MASRKDMRRQDLVVPYIEPTMSSSDVDFMGMMISMGTQPMSRVDKAGTFASTLPMAAIFTRSRIFGWTSVLIALQTWLSETPASKKKATTPAYFTVALSIMALFTAYMQLFTPPKSSLMGAGTGTEAPAPLP